MTFFEAIHGKYVSSHNESVEYNKELAGKGDYLSGKAQAYADVLDMLNSEYVEIKNYSSASPVQQLKAEIAVQYQTLLLNLEQGNVTEAIDYLRTYARQLSAV